MSNAQDTFVADKWNGYPLPPNLLPTTFVEMQRLYLTQLNLALFQTFEYEIFH
jgi:hypothetical protein